MHVGPKEEEAGLTSTKSILGFRNGMTTSFGRDLILESILSIGFIRLTELTELEAFSVLLLVGEVDEESSCF
jgi:hypothetical protein